MNELRLEPAEHVQGRSSEAAHERRLQAVGVPSRPIKATVSHAPSWEQTGLAAGERCGRRPDDLTSRSRAPGEVVSYQTMGFLMDGLQARFHGVSLARSDEIACFEPLLPTWRALRMLRGSRRHPVVGSTALLTATLTPLQ